jgi:hypothetical protein
MLLLLLLLLLLVLLLLLLLLLLSLLSSTAMRRLRAVTHKRVQAPVFLVGKHLPARSARLSLHKHRRGRVLDAPLLSVVHRPLLPEHRSTNPSVLLQPTSCKAAPAVWALLWQGHIHINLSVCIHVAELLLPRLRIRGLCLRAVALQHLSRHTVGTVSRDRLTVVCNASKEVHRRLVSIRVVHCRATIRVPTTADGWPLWSPGQPLRELRGTQGRARCWCPRDRGCHCCR